MRQTQKPYVYRCRIHDKRTRVHTEQQQHAKLKPICNMPNAKWPSQVFINQGGTWNRTRDLQKNLQGSALITPSDFGTTSRYAQHSRLIEILHSPCVFNKEAWHMKSPEGVLQPRDRPDTALCRHHVYMHVCYYYSGSSTSTTRMATGSQGSQKDCSEMAKGLKKEGQRYAEGTSTN